jgi:uncharacterized membrane protein YeaQ/YmgE (transglycosylase-associated protein family)
MDLVWIVLIGVLVGVIAKLLHPGRNEPKGFILTALLGVFGSFVASFLGQFIGYYKPGETAGFFGSIIGAIVVLMVYAWFTKAPKTPAA